MPGDAERSVPFDANETNFLKSDVDGQLYPIDLIVWTLPE